MARAKAGWLWEGYARVYDGLLEFWPYQEVISQVAARSDVPPGGRVLDLGCGTGNLLAALMSRRDIKCVGVDSSAAMLDRASRKLAGQVQSGQLELGQADLLSFLQSQPPASYDRILSVNVFYILHDREQVWRECLRVLKPGGVMVVTTPTVTGSGAIIADHIRHKGWLSLLKGRLVAVFFWDLLIDAFGRSGDFAFASAQTLQAEAERAGGRVEDPVRTYGGAERGVNTLFSVVI